MSITQQALIAAGPAGVDAILADAGALSGMAAGPVVRQESRRGILRLRRPRHRAARSGSPPASGSSGPGLPAVEQRRRVIGVDFSGVYLSCQAEGRAMIRNGGGSIVNIASMSEPGRGIMRPRRRYYERYPETEPAVRRRLPGAVVSSSLAGGSGSA